MFSLFPDTRKMKRCHDDGDILGMNNTRKYEDESLSKEDTPSLDNDYDMDAGNKDNTCRGIDIGSLSERDMKRYCSWKRTVFSDDDVVDMIYPHSKREFNDLHVSIVSACVKMYIGDIIEGAIIEKGDTIGINSMDIEESFSRICRGKRILPECLSSISKKRRRYNMPHRRKDFWSD